MMLIEPGPPYVKPNAGRAEVRVDDPMTGAGTVDSVERLRDTIKKLNCQSAPLIRLRSDEMGRGILWGGRAKSDRPRSDLSERARSGLGAALAIEIVSVKISF